MTSVAGLRVLIVEDEALIAMMAEDMLEEIGCTVVAIASDVAAGLAALNEHDIDAAMLDVNLNGINSEKVAYALKEQATPFIFTTGYGSSGVAPEYSHMPIVAKPYSVTDLHAALARCTTIRQPEPVISMTSIIDSNRG